MQFLLHTFIFLILVYNTQLFGAASSSSGCGLVDDEIALIDYAFVCDVEMSEKIAVQGYTQKFKNMRQRILSAQKKGTIIRNSLFEEEFKSVAVTCFDYFDLSLKWRGKCSRAGGIRFVASQCLSQVQMTGEGYQILLQISHFAACWEAFKACEQELKAHKMCMKRAR